MTEREIQELERQWHISAAIQALSQEERVEYNHTRDALVSRMQGAPSHHDVRWAMLQSESLNHIKDGNWGLFRNACYKMADLLRREDRLREALDTFLEGACLDVNGPQNLGGLFDPELLTQFPPFQEDLGQIAPGVADWIWEIAEELGFSDATLEERMRAVYANRLKGLKLPVGVDLAWSRLRNELSRLYE